MSGQRNILGLLGLHTAAVLPALVALLPFAWLVWASVQASDETSQPTLSNYARLLAEQPMLRWLINSLFLASTHTVLVVALSSLGGFALAKYRFSGRRPIMLIMALTMLLPAQVLLPGSYQLMGTLGWINSYLALIVPSAVSVFGLLLYRQAMTGVPDELLQAARVDGCSELRLWWDIALPVVRPMTAAFTLLSFLSAWNSFLWPQIILQSEALYPLPVGLSGLSQLPQYEAQPGVAMAATVVGILPVLVLFLSLQRDFVAGLTSGALRG
jgi:ABC-type glycerol-3-phosphate transport system permease component